MSPTPVPARADGATGWTTFPPDLAEEWTRVAAWRQAVARRRIALHNDLVRLALDGDQADERAVLIEEYLHDADLASHAAAGVRKWWWGTEVERAWGRLREVETRTVDLLPDDELLTKAANASTLGSIYLKPDNKQLLHLEGLRIEATTKPNAGTPPGLRSSIVDVLSASHAQADRLNQEARYLRNRILLSSVLCLAFGASVLLLQWRIDEARLITTPSIWSGRGWMFLLIVMLFGAIGALLTAIPAMSKVPSDFSPFNLPLQQAILKLSLGPIIAVVGFAILSSGEFNTAPPEEWPGVLLLAVVFGAGQQAVTNYVDKRASQVLSSGAKGSDE